MTNFEKYKDEVLKISNMCGRVAVKDGKPAVCVKALTCNGCLFGQTASFGSCTDGIIKWLYEEYKETAPKLTAKERAFCEAMVGANWYIARDSDGEVSNLFLYEVKPHKFYYDYDETWEVSPYDAVIPINKSLFSFIKWTDEEPWSIEDLLKLEVE